jgi:hypothetical protein
MFYLTAVTCNICILLVLNENMEYWQNDADRKKPTYCSTNCAVWLVEHCTTSWKVAGSFPDGVIGIFH